MDPSIKEVLSGRLRGKRFPVAIETCLQIVGAFVEEIRAALNDPEKREAESHKQARAVHKSRQKDRRASAYAAVDEAREVVKQAVIDWNGDWKRACAMGHISERTADNLLVLLAFYERTKGDEDPNPFVSEEKASLFGVFAKLGRTKLYQIARLPAHILAGLTPETMVTVGPRQIPLKHLSDRELLAFLRKISPVDDRKRIPRLRAHFEKCLRIATTTEKIREIPREDLEVVREGTQELFRKVDRALTNGP